MTSSFQSAARSLSRNLELAKSDDERHSFSKVALQHLAASVFPALVRYGCEKGTESEEYRRAREEVVQLVTLAGISFVRSCTRYGEAVAFLGEVMAACQDPLVRKKISTYSNQLKQKWNVAEPGGILHAPRASKRMRPQKGETWLTAGLGLALLVGCIVVVGLLVQWNLVPSQSASLSTTPQPVSSTPQSPPATVAPIRPEVVQQSSPTTGDFYRYTDDHNVIHIVNDQAKIPERYRAQAQVVGEGSRSGNATPVDCRGDRVLVPVTLKYRGREVRTVLLMDTGATVTTINEQVAERLGVTGSDLRPSTATVADGRRLPTYRFTSDSVAVDGRAVPGTAVSILPGSGGNGAEGLLGVNFLKEFRYHVDFKRGVIEWGS